MTSFYSSEELQGLGFKKIGSNVKISRNACIYSIENIVLSDNVRIDDFCILSGKIKIGRNVHISSYTGIFAGDKGVFIEDFCTISSRCCIYAVSDDYSGISMTNPTIPSKYRNVVEKEVVFKKYSIVGTGCTILPGVVFGEGVSVGAMSLVKDSLEEWSIYVGIPCKKIKERSKNLIMLAEEYKVTN